MPHSWAEVDLDAIRFNLTSIRSRIKPWMDVIAMVKGNAYGHGAVDVSRLLVQSGVSRLGVAFAAEAMELRAAGIRCPILLLGSFHRSDIDDLIVHSITPSVYDLEMAVELSQSARRRGVRVPVHVEVDTGMGRLGVRFERAPWFLENLQNLEGIWVEGIYTHLSSADEVDQTYSRLQIRRFNQVLERLRDHGISVPFTHVQNSAGVLNLSDLNFQGIRPGLALYGLYPSAASQRAALLRPALSLFSRVVMVKKVPEDTFLSYNRTYKTPGPRVIATVSIGYGDGLPRLLSSSGRMLIHGRSYPIVGRVTMDHTMLDLDAETGVRVGDRVTVIGRDGGEEISVDEISRIAQTISYEVTTGLTQRVPRVFRLHEPSTAVAESVELRPTQGRIRSLSNADAPPARSVGP